MKVLILVLSFLSLSFSCQFYIVAGKKESSNYKIAQELIKSSSNICIKQQSNSSAINLYNIINDNKVLFGFFQADILKNAISRDSYKKLSSIELLFPIKKQKIQIAVLKNSSIKKLEDLNNKEISIGKELDDSFMTFLFLSKDLNYDWQYIDDKFNVGISKLLRGEIDAVLSIEDIKKSRYISVLDKIRFIDISGEYFGYKNIMINRSLYKIKDKDTKFNHIKNSKTLGIDTVLAINKNLLNGTNTQMVEELLFNYFSTKVIEIREKPIKVKDDVSKSLSKQAKLVTTKGKALLSSFGLRFADSKIQESDVKPTKINKKLSKDKELFNSICNSNNLQYGLQLNNISKVVCNKLKEEFQF